MVSVALYVPLEAKPGKADDVEQFLRDAKGLADEEPGTTAWFALRMGPTSFAISTPSPTTRAARPISPERSPSIDGQRRRAARDAAADPPARRGRQQAAGADRPRPHLTRSLPGEGLSRGTRIASGILNTRWRSRAGTWATRRP